MHLRGFGHGIAIAAYHGTLWTEYNAGPHGYGRQLCSFPFVNGTTLSGNPHDNPALRPVPYDPLPGSTAATCALDPVNENLIMRFAKDGKQHIAAYRLRDMRRGKLPEPVVPAFAMPKLGDGGGDKGADKFQGYTAYGRYLYCLTGDANPGHGPNTKLWCIDMHTHKLTRNGIVSHAGENRLKRHREPEGMAIYRTSGGSVRLFFGFADDDSDGRGHGGRNVNIFYKKDFLWPARACPAGRPVGHRCRRHRGLSGAARISRPPPAGHR